MSTSGGTEWSDGLVPAGTGQTGRVVLACARLGRSPLTVARDAVRRDVGALFGVERLAGEQYTDPPGDPGLFGPTSVAWRLHADPSVFVGGLAALMLQTLHPLAAAAVAEHSDYRSDPLRRLSRTASFVAATTYGSTEVARQAIEVVRGIHGRVRGSAPDGRAYSADDPDLLRWIHVAEVVSFVRAYERYGLEPLRGADVDRYLSETAVVAEALGATDVPRSRHAVRRYLSEVRPELVASDDARRMLRFLRTPIRHRGNGVRAAHSLVIEAATDLLPAWARRRHGLPATPGPTALAVRPATWSLLVGLHLALGPSPVRDQARRRAAAAGTAGVPA